MMYALIITDEDDYLEPDVRLFTSEELRDQVELQFLRYVYNEDVNGDSLSTLNELRDRIRDDYAYGTVPGGWFYSAITVEADNPNLGY